MKDFKFRDYVSLRESVDDPLDEFYFLNDNDKEIEPQEINHSFYDADKAMVRMRKAIIWDSDVPIVLLQSATFAIT